MREIKFRAWNWSKIIKVWKINRWDDLVWITDAIQSIVWDAYTYRSQESREWRGRLSDIILMQYTWILDKNWKEIYEGDMIKYKTNKIQHSLVQWIGDWFKIVKVESPTRTRTSTLLHFISEYQCEVVWNIYENPDLLTNK